MFNNKVLYDAYREIQDEAYKKVRQELEIDKLGEVNLFYVSTTIIPGSEAHLVNCNVTLTISLEQNDLLFPKIKEIQKNHNSPFYNVSAAFINANVIYKLQYRLNLNRE